MNECALEGLKILDFSTLLPGPYASLLLADLGADVIHVVAPNRVDLVTEWVKREDKESPTELWLGRNKKSLFLDLKNPKSIEAIKKLIIEEGYDIILEQFRPGVMDKLGLGYKELSSLAPNLIYCSLTGYGQTGELSLKAGHDINYLARSGNMAAAGRKNGGPTLYNMQIADVAVGSMNSVVSILSAVIYRNKTGIGQYLDVAMLDGLIPFHTMDGACFLMGEKAPNREEQILNGGGVYDFYKTKDGKYLSVGSLEPKFYQSLCKTLNVSLGASKKEIVNRFLQEDLSYWLEAFKDSDACVEPVLDMEQMLHDKHLNQRNMFPIVETKDGKKVQQLGCPIKMSVTAPKYKFAGVKAGTDSKEILSKLGYSDKDISIMTGEIR